MTDKSGRRNFGSKVEHEPATKFPEMGDHVEIMNVQFYAATKTRKCMLLALMVKNEEDSASTYTPLLIYGITDYDKRNYARKVILIDYRKQMNDGIDLIRQAHEGYLEGLGSASEIKFERKSEIAAVSNSSSGATVDSISLFGDMGSGKSAASTNFAGGDSNDSNKSQDDSAGTSSGALAWFLKNCENFDLSFDGKSQLEFSNSVVELVFQALSKLPTYIYGYLCVSIVL